jgi:hypothetical protein
MPAAIHVDAKCFRRSHIIESDFYIQFLISGQCSRLRSSPRRFVVFYIKSKSLAQHMQSIARRCAMKRFVLTVIVVSLFMSSQLWAGDRNLFGSSKSRHHSSHYTGGMMYSPPSSATTVRESQYKNGRYIGTSNRRMQFQHPGSITKTVVGSTVRSTGPH